MPTTGNKTGSDSPFAISAETVLREGQQLAIRYLQYGMASRLEQELKDLVASRKPEANALRQEKADASEQKPGAKDF